MTVIKARSWPLDAGEGSLRCRTIGDNWANAGGDGMTEGETAAELAGPGGSPASLNSWLPQWWSERFVVRGMIVIALGGLTAGGLAWSAGSAVVAHWLWFAATVPVVAGIAVRSVRDLVAGRLGVDAIAFFSMSAALVLGEPLAGIVVAVMYAGGNLLEDAAIGRAERDLTALVDRAPRFARRRHHGEIIEVDVAEVRVGDTLLVRGGDIIPVDGTIIATGDGAAMIDESALTGEPLPASRRDGDAVLSGTINVGPVFDMRATATAAASAYSAIVQMVASAQTSKSPFIRMADRFALLLLPAALLLAGVAWWWSGDPVRGLAVMVAATPCPLILAAPIAFIAGVSRSARRGVLIKGGRPLEALARAHTVLFDKTGTLTVGGARLVAIETAPGVAADQLLQLAGSLELASPNIVGSAIVAAARARELPLTAPTEVVERHGAGLSGRVGERQVSVGSLAHVDGEAVDEAWVKRANRRAAWRSTLTVFVAVDGRLAGVLLLGDEVRRESARAIALLRSAGVERIVMVTGDRADTAEAIGASLGLDAVFAELSPEQKVAAIAAERSQHPTVMVGDGINDAPALAAADVGIAMGVRGASAASEAADAVVLVDRLDRVADALVIARRSRRIALQSIVAGLLLSAIAMVAAALGYLPPVAGALTQEVIDVAVILNALRAMAPPHRFAGRHSPRPACRR